MSRFLNASIRGAVVVLSAWMVVGCQSQPDEELHEKVAALDAAMIELRSEIQANQAAILKQFQFVKGGQQTMIRRGVAILPDQAKKSVQIGDQTDVTVGSAPTLGDPKASVEVIEFAEFQCPFCMKHASVLSDLVEEYPGKVRVAFKHYPISRHKMAVKAGQAAWAAQQQGKFWEMHDALFASRGELDDDVIRGHAKAIGLDMAKFEADLESPEATKAVFDDRKIAKKIGVAGTPTFYVNGRLMGGDPVAVRKAIDAALARTTP